MALDPSILLTQVESAITALVSGGHSSYSIGARTVTKLNLKELFEERRILLNEIQSSSSGSMRLAKFGRTSK